MKIHYDESAKKIHFDVSTSKVMASRAIPSFAVTGKTVDSKNTWAFDMTGLLWSNGNGWWDIAMDSSGNILVIEGTSTTDCLFKLDPYGSLLWSYHHGNTINTGVCVITDTSDNVYIGGSFYYNYRGIIKLNSAGAVQWSFKDTGWSIGTVWGLAVDSSGNVFAAKERHNMESGGDAYSCIKLNSSGTFVSGIDTGNSERDIAVDSSGNIFVIGPDSSTSYYIKKFDSSWSEIWSKTIPQPYRVVIDNDDNILVACSDGLIKYDTDGVEIWHKLAGKTMRSVAVDSADNVYVAGNRYSSVCIWVYDSSGTLLATFDTGDVINGIAV